MRRTWGLLAESIWNARAFRDENAKAVKASDFFPDGTEEKSEQTIEQQLAVVKSLVKQYDGRPRKKKK